MQTITRTDTLSINEKELLVSLNDHLIISISDISGCIIYFNDNFSKVLGATLKEVHGQANQLLKCLATSKAIYWEIRKTLTTGQKWNGVLFYESQNNTSFWLETTITPLKDEYGNVIKYLIVSRDISNHYCDKTHKRNIKVNSELKAIETKYSKIFQSINVGIIVVANSKGNIIEWNKGAELAFGYSSSEIIDEPLTVLISKKQVDKGVKEILKVKDKLDNDTYGDNIELLGLRKNGEEFPVEFSMSNWQSGEEKFYCAFMLDISNRKKLEEKLKKTTKDLELFLYRSAHDLKAPLTSAEGLLNLLKEEKLDKRGSFLVTMLDETLEKGRLLLDNLAFASIISEKRRAITVVDFQKILGSIMIALKGINNYQSVAFHIAIEQENDFYFNRELIDSILQNLIHNAICFVKPKTETHIPTIRIHIQVTKQGAHLTVADNGLGINKNHLDKVYNLYFKGNSEVSQGTGLGLYIVKRIIDDFNGEINVTSEINKGTSFEVILPNLIEGNRRND
ncbi:PAS domain S-box protein [Xanthomarina sp. F2636L]|uniref:PAS domain S-box protein n=1 Tax=Xanthomarina sp. F2636L TaxID=2996018 RepID=UPI00225E0599|nr:PAS domain S-box protein [Xanthomarina sp. F2636L]MCX7550971.1 PAS domain S-box protein [Xanthomarina sp. F2636L]